MPRPRLTKRADGRYRVKYGSKYFYGYTEREAFSARDAYIAEVERGSVASLSTMTFAEYAMRWLPLYRHDVGKRTYNDYLHILQMANEYIGDIPLKLLTASHVKAAYNSVSHLSASYIKKYTSMIRAVLESACDDGAIPRNPARNVQPPKGTKGTHRALTPEEIALVTETAKDHPFGNAAMVMLFAGLRRGEMLALDIDRDVDFKHKTITVREAVWFDGNRPVVGSGKNDFTAREIPLLPPLERQLAGKHGLILPGANTIHATEQIVTNRFSSFVRKMECDLNGVSQKRWYGQTREHRYLIATGHTLPPWQNVNIRMHDFRHTFCTMLFDSGADMKTAQHYMGHSDPTMIMRIYDHLSAEREKKTRLSLQNLTKDM